jgi:hypothetical protein
VSGLSGSSKFFRLALDKIPCHVLAQTILLWPFKPALPSFDPAVLLEHGINFPEDYLVIGSLIYPVPQTDQFFYPQLYFVLKPHKTLLIMSDSCLRARQPGS